MLPFDFRKIHFNVWTHVTNQGREDKKKVEKWKNREKDENFFFVSFDQFVFIDWAKEKQKS